MDQRKNLNIPQWRKAREEKMMQNHSHIADRFSEWSNYAVFGVL
jgi:hypothetical protein